MTNKSITLIELPATVNGRLNGRLSKDVYSLVKLPSRATDLLAAIAKKAGYKDVLAMNPVFNNEAGKFTYEQLKRIVTSDIIGISMITRTAPQSYELADYIKKINPDCTVVIGGPHSSALPEEALLHANILVMYEGDKTFLELLDALSNGSDLSTIEGIAYKDKNGEIKITPKRSFLTNEELSNLPFPVYTREALSKITHTVINTSRGCPYSCEYCAVIENFGQKYRFLGKDTIIEHIKHTLSQTRKPIFFGDDNMTAIPNRTKALMEEILKQNIKMPPWLAQVRVESARDKELLKLMKKAGCERVCIGFESVNEETLKMFNKQSNVEKNTLAIRRFHEAGISIHGMFIVGAETDTRESILKTSEYARKERIDTVQFTTIVPLPGTKMTKRYEQEKKIISHSWHLYDGHHVTVKSPRLTPQQIAEAAHQAWLDFYSKKEAFKHLIYGNERWFNFVVRLFARKLIRSAEKDSSYYRRAIDALDEWYNSAAKECDNFSKKVDTICGDVKKGLEERKKQSRILLEATLNKISTKKAQITDEYFQVYKKKIIEELEKRMEAVINSRLLPQTA